MRYKTLVATALAAALMLSAMATPAAANPVEPDVGIITGVADVGKHTETCAKNDADETISGNGLGFPLLSKPKNAWFALSSTGGVISLGQRALGDLFVCGKLNPTLSAVQFPCLNEPPGKADCKTDPATGQRVAVKPGIGASCGMSKAWDGVGRVVFPGTTIPTIWLNDIGWKNSAGGFLPVTGQATEAGPGKTAKGKGGAHSDIIAPTFATGGAQCITKRDNLPGLLGTGPKPKDSDPKHGATSFTVATVYAIVPDAGVDRNDLPLHCKPDPDPCGTTLYGPKKDPKMG